ncbi:MAG: AAA family ATPase [Acetatifactor sp.]|nr:AAA family ATPase [Acetatifactor sp.]
MIFYEYGLRWKNYQSLTHSNYTEDQLSRQSIRFDRGNQPESLYSLYNDNKIYAMNDEFYGSFLRDGKYVMNVTRRIDVEINVNVAIPLESLKEEEWESVITEKFPDCEIVEKKELTIENYRNNLALNTFGSTSRILDRLNLKYMGSWSDPLPFTLQEFVPEYCKKTKAKCKKRAAQILGSKSLYEELDRIYSNENEKSYHGHPVHYLVSAGEWEAARDVYELLLDALYSNGRLLSTRQMLVRNVKRGTYRDERYRKAIESAEGGVVIIEMKTEDDMGRFASDFHEFTKVTGMLLEKQKKDTLFIFVEIMGKSFKGSEAINNIVSKADVIQVTEGSGTPAEAKKYLMELAGKVDFKTNDVSDVAEYLEKADSYTVTDIFKAYNAWYGSGLKNHVYKAYKEQKTFKIAITEQENKPYEELRSMIGLTEQKGVIDQIISASKVMKARESMGLKTEGASLHMLFSGNPGTAKTSVARLLAKILKDEDVLKSGKFVECGRQDLVGKYVGWTAKIVEDKFKEAQGGVLFIDEAYSLVDDSNTYGAEAINTIIQLMENYRNEVIVIFAGYTEKMKVFLEQNEGLRSRIAFHLNFPDYNADELDQILQLMVGKRDYVMTEDAVTACHEIFENATAQENFGNGRYVRNLLEQAILRQSERIIAESKTLEAEGKALSKEEMCRLGKEDFKALTQSVKHAETRMGFAC